MQGGWSDPKTRDRLYFMHGVVNVLVLRNQEDRVRKHEEAALESPCRRWQASILCYWSGLDRVQSKRAVRVHGPGGSPERPSAAKKVAAGVLAILPPSFSMQKDIWWHLCEIGILNLLRRRTRICARTDASTDNV